MQEGRGQNENDMADRTPVRVVFNDANVATGLAEFQSGDTIPVSAGGTGLTAIGTAGQILRVNAAGNALEFGAEGDLSVTNLVAPTNADLTLQTSGTGNIVIDSVTFNGTTLSSADSSKITLAENVDVTGTLSVSGQATLGGLAYPTSDGSTNQVLATNGSGTLGFISAASTGDLSFVGSTINGSSNADISIQPAGTGNVVLGAVTINGTTLSSADSTKITFGEAVDVTGALSSTSLNIAGDGATVTGIKDEDNMASDSATKLATQQSIKAYVDNEIGNISTTSIVQNDSNITVADSGSGTITVTVDGSTIGDFTASGLQLGGSGARVTTVLDEDAMGTNSATALATQQSIKAYTDTKASLSGSTDNTIATVTGANALQGESNLTFDGSTFAVTGTATITNTSTDDSLLITSTEDSNSAAPVLTLKRNSGSPADADYLGRIKFKGENDADQEVQYGSISGKILDASDGSEDGAIEFNVKKAGSNNIAARLNSDEFKLLNGTTLDVDGAVTISGSVTSTSLTTNTITSNGSNADLSIQPSGTGDVLISALRINGTTIDSSDSSKVTIAEAVDITGAVTFGSTLTADGGVSVDNITIDGTEIDLSAGDLTLDVAGDIILDADNADIILKDDGTEFGRLSRVSSDLVIKSATNNKDIVFKGVDATSTITALTLDMSEAGAATFNSTIAATGLTVNSAYSLPTADGTNGQAIVTDGAGSLSFGTVAGASASDDSAAVVVSDKIIGATARTIDSFHSSFQDSVLYYVVSNDFNEDCINVQKVSVCHNDTGSFISSVGVQSKASTTMTAFTTSLDNDMVRVKAATTDDNNASLSFYKFGLGDNTSTGTSGNVIISQNTDIDSASEALVSFAHATFRGAKLFISINNTSKTEVGNMEALVVHDGSDAFILAYNGIQSGDNPLLTLTAAIDGDNVVVSAAGLETNLRVTVHAIMLKDTMVSNDGTYANSEAIAPVTISSTATEIDTLVETSSNGAVYYLVSKNASEGSYAVNEVFVALGSGEIAVASGPYVSTKGTNQLTFSTDYKDDVENTGQLFAASTSGASTTVSAYRINLLAK